MKLLDNRASDDDQHLETSDGKLIKLDSPAFLNWLEANNSFRFTAGAFGENGYRARKETLSGGEYWYAVKKVQGKLHKKFIGKSGDVTHPRLVEISKLIRQPPIKSNKPATETTQLEAPNPTLSSSDLEQRVTALETLCNQLQQRLQELVKKSDSSVNESTQSTEHDLQTENEQLRNQVAELTNEVNKLTKQVTTPVVNLNTNPDYQVIRNRVVSNWKIAKRAETKERVALAIDKFIEALQRDDGSN